MKKIEIIKSKDGKVIRKRVSYETTGISLTDQSQEQDTNINNIVAKFRKTRDVNMLRERSGMYADVSQIPDLGEALMTVQKAHSAFDTLPAQLRKRFANDPEEFIRYLQDPTNDDEAIKLGLKLPKKDEPIVPQSVVDKPKGASGKKQPDLPLGDQKE